MSAIQLGDQAGPVVDALGELLSPTEFTPDLLEQLRLTYGNGASMSDAFARWMLRLLGRFGLVTHDASDATAKRLASRVFRHELEHPGRTSQLARAAGEALAARGYHAQVVPADDSVALFRVGEARTPVGKVNERDARALLQELEAGPAGFSPNVLLRPLVQDALFPTVAYVAGPNELAYLAQLGGVYAHFGLAMPLMWPRSSATLVDSAAARFLAKSGLPFEALARNDEGELNRLLERQLPAPVEQAWEAARDDIEGRMQALVDTLPQLDATLQGAARSALGRMRHEIETLHQKMIHAAKRRDDTLRRQFAHARALAFPGGEPQERVVGSVYFLNRYGPWLVERLMADLPLDPGQHWVMTI